MAEEQQPDAPPPPAEVVHLPGPSYLPVLVAFGITLAVCGVVISLVLTVIGAIFAIVGIVLWIRDVRADVAELPLEH